MSTQKIRKDFVSHSVLNDRYPHGRVEKITAEGIWLEGGDRWWHFDKARLKNQVLPKVGAYVVMTESAPGIIGHIATQHELQQPSEAATEPLINPEETRDNQREWLEAYRKEGERVIPIVSMEDYRVRVDALALAVQLLNLEAHYGIDRDDIYRVAQEVIRWIQKRGEE